MKRCLSWFLTLAVLLSTVSTGLFCVTANAASAEEFTVDGIKYKIYNSTRASVVGYTSALPRDVIIPSTVYGYEIQLIEDRAFMHSNIESVFIPSSVKEIGSTAFYYCYWLETVTISYGVESIRENAFVKTAIREIVIPGSVEYIDNYAFSDCEDLETVIIQEGVEVLYYDVFNDCSNLKTLCIPKSIRYVFGDSLGDIDENELTVYGYKGTSAEKLASSHECSFKEIKVTSISVSQNGLKKDYLLGTKFDKENINLYATYSFGKTYKVTDNFKVSGFDSEKLGNQTIILEYGGKQCSFTIRVYSKTEFAQSIKINKLPTKTKYIQNEDKFDSSGGEIEITYKDGSKEIVPLTNHMIKNFSNKIVGTINVAVVFGNCSCSFNVKILDAINKSVRVFWNYLPLYTGDAIEPKPIVMCGEKTLVENKDYSLEYVNNINAGNEAEVLIKGMGDFSNIDAKSVFSIGKADLLNANVSQIDQQYYTGRQVTPIPSVSINGRNLILDTDFTLHYRNNVEVGTATIQIIGIGNYCGSKDISFDITNRVPSYTKKTVGLYNGERKTLEISRGTTVEGFIQKIQYNNFKVIFSLEKITNLDTNEYENVYYREYTLSNVNSVNKFEYTFDEAGIYVLVYKWEEVTGSSYIDSYGNIIYTEVPTGISGSGGYGFIVPEEELGTPENPDTPVQPHVLIAKNPIVQGIRNIYLDVGTDKPNENISNIVWNSSDEDIAQVADGKVTFKKSGSVTITATANNKTAKWIFDLEKINLAKNSRVLSYNPTNGKCTVSFKNELLVEGVDYVIEREDKDDVVIIKIKGINMFEGELYSAFYKNSGDFYNCKHTYINDCDSSCDFCGDVREISHDYKWKIDKNPTCSVSGLKHEECSICGNKRNQSTVIPATDDHNYNSATCTKPAICKVCGTTSGKALSHTYSNSCDKSCNRCAATRTITHAYKTTTTKATLTKNGKTVQTCSVCKKVASSTTIRYVKSFKLSTTVYTCNGKTKMPNVTVKDSAGKTLKRNTDYTVTYASGRKNVGTYKVTIKMKGKYSGTKTLTFKINPAKTTVSKLTAGKKSITVAISKKSTQVTGYQIQYSTSKKFSKATTKTISSYKTTKYTLKSLSTKKTYYVRVRTYKTVGKTKYYSGWSTYKYVKTK